MPDAPDFQKTVALNSTPSFVMPTADSPDWQETVQLVNSPHSDAPDWQQYIVGPGGVPIPAPITNNYDPYIASLSPFLWWKMNDAPGQTVIKDFSGNGYDGTLYGGAGTVAALGVPGPIPGDSALFIATSGSGYPYVTVANRLTLPTITAPFTIIEWFNTSYTVYAMYGSALYSSRQPTEHGFDFCLGPTTSLGQLQSILGDGTNWLTGEQQFNPAGSPVNTGAWWMATTVVTTTGQTVYLQGTAYSATILAALTGALLCDTNHNPVVGNETGGPAATQYNGFVAQLALFNYALTPTQINNAYLAA
jgi:hypothetical protein